MVALLEAAEPDAIWKEAQQVMREQYPGDQKELDTIWKEAQQVMRKQYPGDQKELEDEEEDACPKWDDIPSFVCRRDMKDCQHARFEKPAIWPAAPTIIWLSVSDADTFFLFQGDFDKVAESEGVPPWYSPPQAVSKDVAIGQK